MERATVTWRFLHIGPTVVLVVAGCASPTIVVTPPTLGVPTILALEAVPAQIESGCPIAFRIQFEDAGADVVRAVARWRARTGYNRNHEGTDILPFALNQLHGKSNGQAEVTVVPSHAGSYVYQVQLEDVRGQTSNIAEARVRVERIPFWRQPRCQAPNGERWRGDRDEAVPKQEENSP
jgi:hypothetical protein